MDRDTLETMLVGLGSEVSLPETPPITEEVLRRLPNGLPIRAARRRPRVVAVTAVIVIATVVLLPGPRKAIAQLLGLGGVTITTTIELPQVPTTGGFVGNQVTLDNAMAEAAFRVLIPEGYGDPEAVFFDESVFGGMVTLAYRRGEDSYGLVVTEMLGSVDRPLLGKLLGPDATASRVDVGGSVGYWIEGPHLLIVIDEDGNDRSDEPRLVGNTLLYVLGDVTVRIESGLDLSHSLKIADTLQTYEP